MDWSKRGFTLLEVMVSIAILALAVTTLLVVRNDAIKEAANAIEVRRVRTLLEQKMGELFSGLEKNTSGVFRNEGYPEYVWRASISEVKVRSSAPDTEGRTHEVVLKKISVLVQNQVSDKKFSQTLDAYFPEKRSEDVEEQKEEKKSP